MISKRITAVTPIELLQPLETALRKCGVPGVTVERVQGYGRHPNFFRRDLLKDNARVILYVDSEQVEAIVNAIGSCARANAVRAGIVAVESIDRLIRFSEEVSA